jgi:hypothetical protein
MPAPACSYKKIKVWLYTSKLEKLKMLSNYQLIVS